MVSRVRFVWSGLFLAGAVALSALPAAAAQGASSIATVTVPSLQRVEGATSLLVSATTPLQRDQLVVKSNISWVLVAHTSAAVAGVAWRMVGQTTWQQLGTATPVLQGHKGVHPVDYEVQIDPRVQRDGLPILVTFSVEPVAAQ